MQKALLSLKCTFESILIYFEEVDRYREIPNCLQCFSVNSENTSVMHGIEMAPCFSCSLACLRNNGDYEPEEECLHKEMCSPFALKKKKKNHLVLGE